MKEYGVESSWTRIYKIKQGAVPWNFHYCKPLIFSKNGKKVTLKEGHEGGANLVWYDIKQKRGKRIEIQNLPSDFSTAVVLEVFSYLMMVIMLQKKRDKRKNKTAEI